MPFYIVFLLSKARKCAEPYQKYWPSKNVFGSIFPYDKISASIFSYTFCAFYPWLFCILKNVFVILLSPRNIFFNFSSDLFGWSHIISWILMFIKPWQVYGSASSDKWFFCFFLGNGSKNWLTKILRSIKPEIKPAVLVCFSVILFLLT